MAQIGFNPNSVPDSEFDGGPLPAGPYEVMITEASVEANSANTGHFLKLRLDVVSQHFQGRVLWDRLNYDNPSQQAAQIAQRAMKAICIATGLPGIADSDVLINQRLGVMVGVKNDAQYGDSNVIKNYIPSQQVREKIASAPQPQQPAQQQMQHAQQPQQPAYGQQPQRPQPQPQPVYGQQQPMQQPVYGQQQPMQQQPQPQPVYGQQQPMQQPVYGQQQPMQQQPMQQQQPQPVYGQQQPMQQQPTTGEILDDDIPF